MTAACYELTAAQQLMQIAGTEQRYAQWLSSGRQPTDHERDGSPGANQLRQVLDERGDRRSANHDETIIT